MYVFVLLNCWPAALSPSQLAFFSLGAQIHFATYMSSQSQLIYTIATHPDGVMSPLSQGLSLGQWEQSQEGEWKWFQRP